MEEDFLGKVCVCSTGRAFIVTGKHTFDWGEAWVGPGFDGHGTVASRNPIVIANSGQEFHDRLLNCFGGKLGHNF